MSGDGSYTLTVRLVDAMGNASPPASASYRLDTTPPSAPMLSGPSSPSSLTEPRIAFTVEEGSASTCLLSYGRTARTVRPGSEGWQPCTGSITVDVDRAGVYRVEVRTADAAGNLSPIASFDYTYNPQAPAGLSDLQLPASPGTERLPTWRYTAPSGAQVTCRLSAPDGAVLETGSGAEEFTPRAPLLVDGTHELRITVVAAPATRPGAAPAATPTGSGPLDLPRLAPTAVDRAAVGAPGARVAPGTGAGTDARTVAGVTAGGGEGAAGVVPSATGEAPSEPGTAGAVEPGLALPGGRFTGTAAVGALRAVAEQTISRPQLPLALLALVLAFLLVQNRIDHRDPKLAGGDVDTEDDLVFTPVPTVWRAGIPVRPDAGGTPA